MFSKKRIAVNRKKDHRLFSRTAKKTDVRNIPGKVVQRGGIRL